MTNTNSIYFFLDLIRAKAIIKFFLNIGPEELNIWMDFIHLFEAELDNSRSL